MSYLYSSHVTDFISSDLALGLEFDGIGGVSYPRQSTNTEITTVQRKISRRKNAINPFCYEDLDAEQYNEQYYMFFARKVREAERNKNVSNEEYRRLLHYENYYRKLAGYRFDGLFE